MQIYEIKTLSGVTIRIEANSSHQAEQRAKSPRIIREFSRILQLSLNEIASVKPLRGPSHRIRSLIFTDEFFNNL